MSVPLNSFSALGLAQPILKALAAEGYAEPTPIQIQAVPHVLDGRDVLGLAQTGTGKTAAFATPILHRLAANRRHPGARACRVLVLAPTRELAAQICDGFRTYGRFLGIGAQVVFGGVPIGKQIRALERGTDVLVATPGRLLDLVMQRALRLDAVETLVIDEADHMMDLGFIVPLRRIRALVPVARQTLFFSATMPEAIAHLAHEFLTDPVRVAVTPVASTPDRVAQSVVHTTQPEKQTLLLQVLEDPAIARALVFTRTKHGADRVVKRLAEAGIDAHAIHGNKSQGQRERALDAFKKGRARLLVATDIAARGIDVDNVTHVIQFDLPDTPEAYVHRIGRTARAGADGAAIAFCAPEERGQLRDIERLMKKAVPVIGDAPRADERAPQGRPPRRPQQKQTNKPHRAQRPAYRPERERNPERAAEHGGHRLHPDRHHGERHPEQRAEKRPESRSEPRADQRNAPRHDQRPKQRKDRNDVWSNQAPARPRGRNRPR